jgi:hypothetical protein
LIKSPFSWQITVSKLENTVFFSKKPGKTLAGIKGKIYLCIAFKDKTYQEVLRTTIQKTC